MNITKQYITQNPCYKAGETIKPKGIMVHSTATPGVMGEGWYSRWNKSTKEVAVHAFVDHTGVYQHLPFTMRAWHCAGGGNNTHIAFEICEPVEWKTDADYFIAAYQNAVDLAAYLCQQYGIQPGAVISHKEGFQKGIASNHGDPEHWFKHFGYSMDTFRKDLKTVLQGKKITPAVYTQHPLLECGDTGESVVYLQNLLNLAKQKLPLTFAKLETDGIFGAKTLFAVKDFQVNRNLLVDGVVGPNTWKALIVRNGDVNGDGKLTATDALKVLRHTVGKETLPPTAIAAADVNDDGTIDAKDAKTILQQSVES